MNSSTATRHIIASADGWICASCRSCPVLSARPTVRPTNKGRAVRLSGEVSIRHHASASAHSSQNGSQRNHKLPSFPARTRFAPSPTGYMHIGGLRTALFSYLLAKRTSGQFLLRIEDTDQKRFVHDAEDRLCEDLLWAGLQWDEGPRVNGPFGPYRQSERTEIYQTHARHLLDSGSAYRCFCTPQTTGSGGLKAAFVTSGCYQDCSSLRPDQAQERAEDREEPFTVRLRQPADVHKRVYRDLIYGKIQRLKRSPSASQGGEDDSEVDTADTILVKSDGTPTYHFANVVDDHLMQITHVIRGSEWMASTPLHYDLYTAFGWDPPEFAHVGLLVDANKAKLSKRSDTGLVLDVRGMREQEGILPAVLCNFLALLGWSNPGRDDVLEMHELIRDFDLKFTKGNTVVKMEKLWFLQKHHVARKCEQALSDSSQQPIAGIVDRIVEEVRRVHPDASTPETLETFCAMLLLVDSKSYQTPKEYIERNRYFFAFHPNEVPQPQESYGPSPDLSATNLAKFLTELLARFDWTQPYRRTTFLRKGSNKNHIEANTKGLITSIEQTSARIHAAINLKVWEEIVSGASSARSVNLPYTPDAVDVEACALHIANLTSDVVETDVHTRAKTLVDQYKGWNKALMRYLRERLSYGLPGPGVGHIMALLGYKECCRRLGVDVQEKQAGW